MAAFVCRVYLLNLNFFKFRNHCYSSITNLQITRNYSEVYFRSARLLHGPLFAFNPIASPPPGPQNQPDSDHSSFTFTSSFPLQGPCREVLLRVTERQGLKTQPNSPSSKTFFLLFFATSFSSSCGRAGVTFSADHPFPLSYGG